MFMSPPAAMADPEVRAEREAMKETSVAYRPLAEYERLLTERRLAAWKDGDFPVRVPSFDPADAGADAKVLILLESPGPMTSTEREGRRQGSGFISPDNDDFTARNTWSARHETRLDEGIALQWNIVPWLLAVGVQTPTSDEVRQGALELRRLLEYLPRLEVIVACGKPAQDALTRFIEPAYEGKYSYLRTWHPGQRAMAVRGRREELVAVFGRAARLVGA
ncbi:hypothetical protein GCM10025867_50180 (plasmid) [Frondihabitans sucicola]|uniref:Uracil-DNA glycosylase n=1 Tax=Frondihabitans sucicola TaxID=1268041 RepID=A0ABN6Y602_9MICO|nr:uracil-DNA glycosylase [Frondihabitans sucicola]BDZ52777.1 hypothetical protein GCM10025867_50180 [Frondihabitans sucicola]